ncbi:tRNA dihydrouridine synthase DusB [bacterium]|nr:tRNA dihydrouridine synthase DusB [bacterium]
MIIGDLNLSGRAILAPMSGITNSPFRLIAKSWGAALVYTELISADGVVRGNNKTHQLFEFSNEERPIGIQLFGSDPGIMAEAASKIEKYKPELIDLNFGCPSKKIVRQGAGAALLQDLAKMRKIVKAVVSHTSIPVSGKIRSGWNESNVVAVEASQILEDEGACAVTVHPRTQKMGFKGHADWEIIKNVKKSVSILVIGNGDVKIPEDGKRMMEETNCDLIMIGRGALGKPWIFQQVNHNLENDTNLCDPSFQERIKVCLKHYQLTLELCEEERGVKEMRKHIGWYLQGMPESRQVRLEIFKMDSPKEVENRLHLYANQLRS